MILGTEHGLGKKQSLLSNTQERAIIQAEYAGDLFYVLALGLAKISTLLLLRGICVNKKHKTIAFGTSGVVLLWVLAAIVALAVRCGAHLPWTSTDVQHQCVNLRGLWGGLLSVDILTELVIIILPIFMMLPVQTTRSKKAVIIAAFMCRLTLVAASIVRIFYVVDYVPSREFAFKTVNTEILNQVVLSISITSACVPCLKPFLDVFESGQMAVTLRKGGTNYGSNSYPLGSMAREASRNTVQAGRDTKESAAADDMAIDQAESVSSDTKSDKMIISKKVEYSVQYVAENEDDVHGINQRNSSATSKTWRRFV